MRRWIIAVVALLPVACDRLFSPTSNPDGPHTLAMYEHKEGDVYRVTRVKTSETDGSATSVQRGKEEKVVMKEKMVFTEEILEKPAGAKWATRLRRTYEVVEKSRSGKALTSHLVGKTVDIEWSEDKKPKFKVDGQPPTAAQAQELEGEFGKTLNKTQTQTGLLPNKPVKVGETWQIDREAIVAGKPETPGVEFDTDHCRVTGKLVKMTNVGGRLQATVEYTIRVPITEFGAPGRGMFKADDASKMTVTATVEFCADGSSPGEWVAFNGQGRVGSDLRGGGLIVVHYTESGTIREEPVTK